MPTLRAELADCGVDREPWEFEELLANVKAAMFPGQTIDWLLCDEFAPGEFVARVRDSAGVDDLPHALILTTLLNTRKKDRRRRAALAAAAGSRPKARAKARAGVGGRR
jgi:hypothetical protein